ncbi:epoxide hydrolase 3 isoform X2 [Phalacrocorax carbo]|uniref:epoxide hydrolase 3 isoform X2 n=1 Tax=Phalacrocorax carbo TaxID=9209 RepID=UPI00311995B0
MGGRGRGRARPSSCGRRKRREKVGRGWGGGGAVTATPCRDRRWLVTGTPLGGGGSPASGGGAAPLSRQSTTGTPRFCWRHLLQEFGTTYRVAALDLRGYGASEKPPEKDSYRLEVLLDDVRQVIEALGTPDGQGEVTSATGATAAAPKCILVGHDWGGLLAWEFAASHPTMVEKLVVMGAPHRAVVAGFAACHPSQLLRSSYVFLFQLPWLPELLLSLADFELLKTILTGPWTGIENPARRLSAQEVDAYLYSLSQPGALTPPIHYYRNLFRDTPIPREPPPLPTLLLWGTHDAFLDPRLAPCLHRCLRPSARLCLLPGASHWLPEDQPRPLARLMADFLGADDHHP